MPTHRITRLVLLTVTVFILAAAPAQAFGQLAPQQHEVTVSLTVIDKDKNLIDVRAEDLRLSQRGAAQRITKFQKISDSPVSLGIIIDSQPVATAASQRSEGRGNILHRLRDSA